MQLYGGAVVLPAFDAPADSLELYFWAKSGGGSIRNLYVGLVTDPLDMSTFVPLDTVDGFVQEMDRAFGKGSCHVLNVRPAGADRLIL